MPSKRQRTTAGANAKAKPKGAAKATAKAKAKTKARGLAALKGSAEVDGQTMGPHTQECKAFERLSRKRKHGPGTDCFAVCIVHPLFTVHLPKAKAKTMRGNMAILKHQLVTYQKEVSTLDKYAWARGDGTGKDKSDWGVLMTLGANLDDKVNANTFNDAYMNTCDVVEFKKTSMEIGGEIIELT